MSGRGGQVLGDVKARFWAKVAKGEADQCWLWTGATFKQTGYGAFNLAGRSVTAHRLGWELKNGPMPDGMYACHRCDNPPCVNPGHIFPGTPGENIKDAVAKGRRLYPNDHCRGEKNTKAVLTEESVRAIRASSEPARVFAQRYGVGETTVKMARTGKTWRHVR